MTYELYVFDDRQVADVQAARAAHEAAPYFDSSLPTAEKGARKWRTARALQTGDAGLRIIDHGEGVRRGRSVNSLQVASPDATQALCLHVFDDAAEIVIEVPDEPGRPEALLREVWDCLARLHREGLGVVYDPQADRLLDIDRDHGALLQALTPARRDHAQASPPPAASPAPAARGSAKAWWKFW